MLLSEKEAWYGLCEKCRQTIHEDMDNNPENHCDLCGRLLISEKGRCLPCRESTETELPSYERIISLFPYTGKYIKLLEAFKFHKSLAAGHFLAEQLLEALESLPLETMEKPVLVPVPPRPGKIRKTGWDQIVCLSRLLKKSGKINGRIAGICPFLKRQASQTQKKLDRRERQTNLKGRIIAKGIVPRECILFDDVNTTGATMNVCASALKKAGAEKVYGICLFYD